MADKPKIITAEEALVLQAEALRNSAEAYARLGLLYGAMHKAGGAALPANLDLSVPLPLAEDVSADLAKLPLQDAVYIVLDKSPVPMKPKEIWGELAAAGRVSDAANPSHSVQWALRKRKVQNDDVVLISFGQWHTKTRYSKAALKKVVAKAAGRGGRTAEEHGKLTKKGIEDRRRSGGRIGAAKKFTDQDVEAAKSMLLAGAKSSEVAKKFGISMGLFYMKGLGKFRKSTRRVKEDIQRSSHVRLVASNE